MRLNQGFPTCGTCTIVVPLIVCEGNPGGTPVTPIFSQKPIFTASWVLFLNK